MRWYGISRAQDQVRVLDKVAKAMCDEDHRLALTRFAQVTEELGSSTTTRRTSPVAMRMNVRAATSRCFSPPESHVSEGKRDQRVAQTRHVFLSLKQTPHLVERTIGVEITDGTFRLDRTEDSVISFSQVVHELHSTALRSSLLHKLPVSNVLWSSNANVLADGERERGMILSETCRSPSQVLDPIRSDRCIVDEDGAAGRCVKRGQLFDERQFP
jgi:hypothetical protein